MIIGIISVSLWVLTVIGFIIFNLYQKNVKMERAIVNRDSYISLMRSQMGELDPLIAKIDTTIWVQSDPEIASLFETIKALNETVKRYNPDAR
jgi:hypothetical protein